MFIDILFIVLGLAALFGGGTALVRGASDLARGFGVSPLWIGLTVVAFGTSAPELVVSSLAAARDQGPIALGNVLGSNIANIGLILAVSALIRPIVVESRLLRADLPVLAAVSLGVAALLFDGELGRVAGGVLVVVLLAWIVIGARMASNTDVLVEEAAELLPEKRLAWAASIGFVLLGLVLLVVGAEALVRGAVSIARDLGMSETWIGLTVVAIGTSLPELATSIVAASRGQSDVAVGNVVGSNVFNSTGILGIAALVRPLRDPALGVADLAMMLALALVLIPLARTRGTISRREGAVLLVVYVIYIGWRSQ